MTSPPKVVAFRAMVARMLEMVVRGHEARCRWRRRARRASLGYLQARGSSGIRLVDCGTCVGTLQAALVAIQVRHQLIHQA